MIKPFQPGMLFTLGTTSMIVFHVIHNVVCKFQYEVWYHNSNVHDRPTFLTVTHNTLESFDQCHKAN